MIPHIPFARSLRWRRLGRRGAECSSSRSTTRFPNGPIAPAADLALVGEIASNGADAIVPHKEPFATSIHSGSLTCR